MILYLLLLIPLLGAAAIFAIGRERGVLAIALLACTLETIAIAGTVWQVVTGGALQAGRYLRADALTAFYLLTLALVFALVLIYASGYMRHIRPGRFSSPRWFYGLLFLFYFTMAAVYLSANLGMLWISVEATTLASALLVGFYNTKGAVEAGWKYLIVCTVGIAFALFGTIAIYLAAVRCGVNASAALDWAVLMAEAPKLGAATDLVKLGFVFVAVGYGTKIGFVPMHSWLPDAHAEAPSPISALLSAVLLNCAMYSLLRFDAISVHAIGAGFSHSLLLIFGAISVTMAAFLMIVQRDFKRLLAYSSIEHMGLVALGAGIGGSVGLFGALLHTFNHSIAKSLMFFVSGSVKDNYGTLRMKRIRGMAKWLPCSSAALIVGALALTGMPPFGLFLSEFTILNAAFGAGNYVVAGIALAGLFVVFGALLHHFQPMLAGKPPLATPGRRPLATELTVLCLCAALLLLLGVQVPWLLSTLLQKALAVLQ